MKDIVEIVNGRPMTNTLKVAEAFGKTHAEVINSIKVIRNTLNLLEIAQIKFDPAMIGLQTVYFMDQNAFSVLTYGFTGKQAMGARIPFLEKFNQLALEVLKAEKQLFAIDDIPQALRSFTMKQQEDHKTPDVSEDPVGSYFKKLNQTPTVKATSTRNYIKKRVTGRTNAVRWVFPSLGLKPTLTTRWLIEQSYLTTQPYVRKRRRVLNLPTPKGKAYFQSDHSLALLVTEAGIKKMKELKATGAIPGYCLLDAA